MSSYRAVPNVKTNFMGTVFKVLAAGTIISGGIATYQVYCFLYDSKYATLEKVKPYLPSARIFQRGRPDIMYDALSKDARLTLQQMKSIRAELEPVATQEERDQKSREAREETIIILKGIFGFQRTKMTEIVLKVEPYFFTQAEIEIRKKKLQSPPPKIK